MTPRRWTGGGRWSAPNGPASVWVVLAGDSKAGRSTWLNARLRRPLLRVGVRACTRAAVAVRRGGVWWVEVPPGVRWRGPVHAWVAVVDVRQPLPQSSPFVGAEAPWAVWLTKLDRAAEDALFAENPADEVAEAVEVATARAQDRFGDAVQVVAVDPRRTGARPPEVPALVQAARAVAAARRPRQAPGGCVASTVASPPDPWPPPFPAAEWSARVCHAGAELSQETLLAELLVLRGLLVQAPDVAALEAAVVSAADAVREVLRRALDTLTRAREAAWQAVVHEMDVLETTLARRVETVSPPVRVVPPAPAVAVVFPFEARIAALRALLSPPPSPWAGVRQVTARWTPLPVRRHAALATWDRVVAPLAVEIAEAVLGDYPYIERAIKQIWQDRIDLLIALHGDMILSGRPRPEAAVVVWRADDSREQVPSSDNRANPPPAHVRRIL